MGASTAKERKRAKKLIAPTTQNFDFAPSITRGVTSCWIKDEDGVAYFDAHSGPGVFNIGHRHPALEEVKRKVVFGYGANEYPSHESNELAEKLVSLSPGNFDKRVFFSSSGTESVEAAIRAAQIYRRSPTMMAFEGAFHGRTSGARTLTDRAHVTRYSYPAFPVIRLPFPEALTEMGNPDNFMKCVRRMLATKNLGEVAALFWEPIQGEGGIRVTSHEAFKALMNEIILPNGILLVADEVQTFSRTGKWFASEHFGFSPDIICVAKALGGGAPIGATIMREGVCWPEGGLYSNTWGGNPFCCACALATLDVLKNENLIERSDMLGHTFEKVFTKELFRLVGNINGVVNISTAGMGLMCRIDFKDPRGNPLTDLRNKAKKEAFNRRILLMSAGDSALRVMPPLVVSEEEIKWLARELTESIASAIKSL